MSLLNGPKKCYTNNIRYTMYPTLFLLCSVLGFNVSSSIVNGTSPFMATCGSCCTAKLHQHHRIFYQIRQSLVCDIYSHSCSGSWSGISRRLLSFTEASSSVQLYRNFQSFSLLAHSLVAGTTVWEVLTGRWCFRKLKSDLCRIQHITTENLTKATTGRVNTESKARIWGTQTTVNSRP